MASRHFYSLLLPSKRSMNSAATSQKGRMPSWQTQKRYNLIESRVSIPRPYLPYITILSLIFHVSHILVLLFFPVGFILCQFASFADGFRHLVCPLHLSHDLGNNLSLLSLIFHVLHILIFFFISFAILLLPMMISLCLSTLSTCLTTCHIQPYGLPYNTFFDMSFCPAFFLCHFSSFYTVTTHHTFTELKNKKLCRENYISVILWRKGTLGLVQGFIYTFRHTCSVGCGYSAQVSN